MEMPKWLKIFGRLVITSILIYLLYLKVDFASVFNQIRKMKIGIIVISVLLNYAGSITIQSLITKNSSKTFRASIWDLDKINLSMRMYMMIVPMAAVSVIRWRRYNLLGASKSHSFILMIQNKILQLLFIAVFIIVSLFYYQKLFYNTFQGGYGILLTVSLAIFFSCLYVLTVIIGLSKAEPFIYFSNRFANFLPSKLSLKVQELIKKFRDSLKEDHSISRLVILKLLLLALTGHVLILLSQFFATIAIGMQIDFMELAFSRSFVQLLLMLPITVAGIGAREFGFISTLAIFGVVAESATALSITLLSFQILFGLMGLIVEIGLFMSPKRAI